MHHEYSCCLSRGRARRPELITVKGRRLLDEADVIVYAGSLVNPVLLDGVQAEIHDSASMTLDEVLTVLCDAWQAGKKAVRLHTGDPAIYGATREQMQGLSKKGIPYQVVPGVSSALAAAAALQAELTVPEVSQTVIFTRQAGRTPVPEQESLRNLAAIQASMCIFLSVSMIDKVVEELIAGVFRGYPYCSGGKGLLAESAYYSRHLGGYCCYSQGI